MSRSPGPGYSTYERPLMRWSIWHNLKAMNKFMSSPHTPRYFQLDVSCAWPLVRNNACSAHFGMIFLREMFWFGIQARCVAFQERWILDRIYGGGHKIELTSGSRVTGPWKSRDITQKPEAKWNICFLINHWIRRVFSCNYCLINGLRVGFWLRNMPRSRTVRF